MNIQDALKETGKAKAEMWAATYIALNKEGMIVQYAMEEKEELGPIPHSDFFRDDWQPYHPKEEIRPKEAGELWKYQKRFLWFTRQIRMEDGELSEVRIVCQDGDNSTLQSMPNAIHNQNGWKRLYPTVEDCEEIVVPEVEWFVDSDDAVYPFQGLDKFDWKDLVGKGPMTMTLNIPKETP